MGVVRRCGVLFGVFVLLVGGGSAQAQTREVHERDANHGAVLVYEAIRSCAVMLQHKRNVVEDTVQSLQRCKKLHTVLYGQGTRVAVTGVEVGIGGSLTGGVGASTAPILPYVAALAGLIATGVCVVQWEYCKANALAIAKKVRVYLEASFFTTIALARYHASQNNRAASQNVTEAQVNKAIADHLEKSWVQQVQKSNSAAQLQQHSTGTFRGARQTGSAGKKQPSGSAPGQSGRTPPDKEPTPEEGGGVIPPRNITCSKRLLDNFSNVSRGISPSFDALMDEVLLLLQLLQQELLSNVPDSDALKKKEIRKKLDELRNLIYKADCFFSINPSLLAGSTPEQMLRDVKNSILHGEYKSVIHARLQREINNGNIRKIKKLNNEHYVRARRPAR